MIENAAKSDPWARYYRWVEAQTGLLIYVLALFALTIVPLKAFIWIAGTLGGVDHDVLKLQPAGKVALSVLILFTITLSMTIGAFAKIQFARLNPDLAVMIATSCGVYWGVTALFGGMREATTAVTAVAQGDNVKAGLFIGFWILMLGFAAKALWDQGRDQIAKKIANRISPKSPDRHG